MAHHVVGPCEIFPTSTGMPDGIVILKVFFRVPYGSDFMVINLSQRSRTSAARQYLLFKKYVFLIIREVSLHIPGFGKFLLL